MITAGVAIAMDHGHGSKAGESCQYCGMSLQKFAHSAMMIKYSDGTMVKTCSVHCAAVDLAIQIDKTPEAIMVADYNTKMMVDAEDAVWVLGGKKPGVMTKRAKWAFKAGQDAQGFIKENGGQVADLDAAMTAAYMDMYVDTKMIRDKRKMMKMKGMKH